MTTSMIRLAALPVRHAVVPLWRLFLLATLALAPPAAALSQETSRYSRAPESPDGIGKVYMGREIARVMGWQGAAWLNRAERAREERPDLLLAALELKPGMSVADVGAGTGYYSAPMAKAVAPGGRVYAVDVQPQMLALIKKRMASEAIDNIVPVLGANDDVRLAPNSIDLALLVDTYHELDAPYEVMASLVRALKPGGRLVLVEYRAEDPAVPIKPLHKMSEAQVKRELDVLPLRHERTDNRLPWQHLVVFRRLDVKPGKP